MPVEAAAVEGSSPHTRGAPLICITDDPDVGIIPAYAGSTQIVPLWPISRSDHPRIRGEHCDSAPSSASNAGSSPHTRGAPQPHQTGNAGRGIIPAYAGSTRVWRIGYLRCWDHPRIRGEHL